MGVLVKLNQRSQHLIIEYLILRGIPDNHLTLNSSSLEDTRLVSWLSQEDLTPPGFSLKAKKDLEFTIASLRAELLSDLLTSLNPKKLNLPMSDAATWHDKVKFILLTLAGTLVAGSEGFDSISTMLTVLFLPPVVILVTGLVFSVLSIIVFYGFDLVQVSRNLGVKLKDAPRLMDIYIQQLAEIKAIRRTIDSFYLSELSFGELMQLESTLVMLELRFQSVIESSRQFKEALQSTQMKATKFTVSAIAGLIFFGSGFFAGQSVALFIANLVFTAATATFWPVILFSLLVGAAAFSIYWYVERPGLKNLIGGWFGLEEDKIKKLCDEDYLQKEEDKLRNLKEKIISTSKLTKQLTALQLIQENSTHSHAYSPNIKLSQNPNAFVNKLMMSKPSDTCSDAYENEHVLSC